MAKSVSISNRIYSSKVIDYVGVVPIMHGYPSVARECENNTNESVGGCVGGG